MIILLRKKNLIISLIITISLFFLAYLDISSRTEGFFKSVNAPQYPTVIIDAGHGGEDPGAVSNFSMTKEKDINLMIAIKLKKLLESSKYSTIMTRTEDVLKYEPGTTNIVKKRKQDLETRKMLIDKSGANIVVSIHLNKFPQEKYFGAQVFYPPNFPESKKLGECIQGKIREMVDINNKREALVKKEPIVILKNPKVTTAIVECGFLSNPDEEKRLITDEYQNKLATSIKAGIDSYFNKSLKAN
jgi:N-acetylmuramoyl-L-alanine amidase